MSDVTIQSLEEKAYQIASKRDAIAEIGKIKDQAKAELDILEDEMKALLSSAGKQSYNAEVGRVGISYRESVKMPKDMESKVAFFEYLKEKGVFEEMVGVNSQTLNSYWKTEKAIAEDAGDLMFAIPGLEQPTSQEIISFTKKK